MFCGMAVIFRLFSLPLPHGNAARPLALPARPVALTSGTVYLHNLPMLTLDGRPVNLSELKGKVVFVNLWASWCPTCRAEMHGTEALYKKVDKSKVAFVMLCLDDNAAKARKFVQS